MKIEPPQSGRDPSRPMARLLAEGRVTAPVDDGMPDFIDDLVPELDSLTDVLLAERTLRR